MVINNIIDTYDNYEEENRMKSNNARKVEFIVTTLLLEDLLKGNLNILDCAAGTGVYSLFLANIGHYVTTLDITKKHIEIINQKLEGKKYNVETAVNEARGLEMFDDESFDVVLCMGPLYHLTEEIDRNLCFEECYRVLKKGGLLISSYTSRFSVIPNLVTKNFPLPKNNLIKELWSNGTLSYDDYLYLGAEIYYHTPCEMEELYDSYELKLIDHLGVDGTSLLLANSIDQMNDEEFDIWLDYHLSVCREKSIIGISSHGLLIGEK